MSRATKPHCCWSLLLEWLVAYATVMAQSLAVTGHLTLLGAVSRGRPADNSNAVLYLTPLEGTRGSAPVMSAASPRP